MPTYDYICSTCGKTTEIVHSISGSAPASCPACGAVGTLSKAFNPPTIHFKGSGWAKKDRSGGRAKPAKSTESTESGSRDDSGADRGRSSDSDKGGEAQVAGAQGGRGQDSGGKDSGGKDSGGKDSGAAADKLSPGPTKSSPAAASSSSSAD
jgi:putative FmdB family regulatory protein